MEHYKQLDEAELVKLMKQGKELALAELINRYQKTVARVVIGMLGNCPEADDVGQETFIRFWSSVENYRHDAKVSTFLTRIAINLSINELRKRKKRYEWLDFLEDKKNRNITIIESDQYIQTDEQEHITKALASIEPDQRAVVILRLVQGYSTKETAEMLDIPLGTVLSRLSRGLEKLRIEINKLEEA
ncbi:MAG: RNA polymerase sigma factor [Bacteroidales bacterium]|nr:RNA polymerase sigma factor [Bacteroidales bacterium]